MRLDDGRQREAFSKYKRIDNRADGRILTGKLRFPFSATMLVDMTLFANND
jgi:hypothetical protein